MTENQASCFNCPLLYLPQIHIFICYFAYFPLLLISLPLKYQTLGGILQENDYSIGLLISYKVNFKIKITRDDENISQRRRVHFIPSNRTLKYMDQKSRQMKRFLLIIEDVPPFFRNGQNQKTCRSINQIFCNPTLHCRV